MKKRGFCVISALVMAGLSGCASITGDTTQVIRVETKLADGSEVKDAECELFNEYGSFRVKTPGSVLVRRSATDLNITCEKPELLTASAKAVSRANAGMFGNIIFGGGIGAIIDHNKGTAYTYPQWMQLSFGKILSFDRSDDKDGQPSFAKEVGQVNPPKREDQSDASKAGSSVGTEQSSQSSPEKSS